MPYRPLLSILRMTNGISVRSGNAMGVSRIHSDIPTAPLLHWLSRLFVFRAGASHHGIPKLRSFRGRWTVFVSCSIRAGRPGNFSRTVSIKFSCSDTPLSLTIRGNVTAGKRSADGEYPVSAGDGLRMTHKALNFGQMGQNVSRSYTVGFFNGSSQEIRLSFRIDPHTSWLRVKGGGIVKPGGRCTAEVSCFITGDTLYGCCDCRLIPCIGNRPIGAGISVAVVATDNFEQVDPERVPRLAVDASYFEFGRTRTMEHTFTLSNTGTEPLIVRRVECSRGISADTETPLRFCRADSKGFDAGLRFRRRTVYRRCDAYNQRSVESRMPTAPAIRRRPQLNNL